MSDMFRFYLAVSDCNHLFPALRQTRISMETKEDPAIRETPVRIHRSLQAIRVAKV